MARVRARAAPRHVEEGALAKTRNEVAVKTLNANHWFEGSGKRQQGDSESDEPSTTPRARDLADRDRCELRADCTLRSLPMMIATARATGRRGGLESLSGEQRDDGAREGARARHACEVTRHILRSWHIPPQCERTVGGTKLLCKAGIEAARGLHGRYGLVRRASTSKSGLNRSAIAELTSGKLS